MEAFSNDTTSVLKVPVTQEQMQSLLDIQQQILGQLAVGVSHQLVLDELCVAAEAMFPNAVASIMLFNDDHESLYVRSAPNVPPEAISALSGLTPGKKGGSCGTAVYKNEPQFVCDTLKDERWSDLSFQDFATQFGIFACWSMPIRNEQTLPVGSFALSSLEKRQPHEFHQKLLETCANIASIIVKREEEQSELQRLAHFDSLTGLPNRVLFNLRLEHAIEKTKRTREQLAILFIDLDNFKDINDTLGHNAGDAALKMVTKRILRVLREQDTLSRMGGDEFTLMIEDISDPLDVGYIAEKILESLQAPLTLDNTERLLSASIGIAIHPSDGEEQEVLLRNADMAMFEAKKRGRGQYYYYEQDLTKMVSHRLSIEKDLRKALRENQFILHYQPQFSCENEAIIGAEVLVRWNHPERGIIPPLDFIAIAEESELICELDWLVMRGACEQYMLWREEGLAEFALSINLSAKGINKGYAKRLLSFLTSISFPVEQLEIEVTESVAVSDLQGIEELNELRLNGLSISMDDFGTGHSSLAQLKNMPISKLKIDRSFVSDIPRDKNDEAIVQTILAMSKILQLKVVAEGVETQEQLDFLKANDCDFVQGFFLSKPIDAENFKALIS